MKRLIGAGLSILIFSALSASGVKAQTRYDYQLGLTHHSLSTSVKEPVQIAVQLPSQPQQTTATSTNPEVSPITSGNPYAGRS
jgi:hypothetical protein